MKLNKLIKLSIRKIIVRKIQLLLVILHWLKNNGEYKTSVSNRVSKIRGKCYAGWKYVPTKKDTVDLGSRGCEILKLNNRWWEGTKQLQDLT